jgi:hypothetical protein
MYHLDSQEEWNAIHPDDLWVYNKLFLSQKLGYLCGPVGVPVPHPDTYIVRPMFNLLGMGRFARLEWIDKTTDHFHPSEFWCEVFEGDHISVDFYQKSPILTVLGMREPENPLYKWSRWEKIEKNIEFPKILTNLSGNYDYINCEFIGNRLIEVHFRQNPDFRYDNDVAIPVWDDDKKQNYENLKFIEDKDYLRKGFFIEKRDSNPVKSSDLTKSGEQNGKTLRS